jgi:histone deacetylase 11
MPPIQPHIIYTPDYDIHFMGLENLHPFDSRKYSRAWNRLHEEFGTRLEALTIAPPCEISRDELLTVHTPEYLDELKSSHYVAMAVELPFIAAFPMFLIDRHLLRPMRLATMGTLLAAELALQSGIAVNMSGGYHHASASKGEGFCLYSDIALAVVHLRNKGLLAPDDPVLILDLDVHQGNGHERVFLHDPAVTIMDMYNAGIYPDDRLAMQAIKVNVPLPSGTDEGTYMGILKSKLPVLLDEMPTPKLVLYIAGTDIYTGDQLGMLRVSEDGILRRDSLVFDTFAEWGIPLAMTLGGGYSRESYRFVANAVRYVIQQWG